MTFIRGHTMSQAKRIKKLREKLIVSQKELGDILGVSYVTFNR